MNKRHRTLILDTDPETLITLQQAFEEVEIDATITWDEMEACQLIESAAFDLILIGHHPPELNAVAILDDLSLRGSCPPVFILMAISSEKDREYFRRFGATAVVSKRDPLAVLDQVTKALAPIRFKATTDKTRLPEPHVWRTAS